MWLSAGELVVVGILALLVFGPEKLPELARQLARFVAQLQNIAAEVKRNVDDVIHHEPDRPAEPPHVGLSPAEQEHERYLLAAAQAEGQGVEEAPAASEAPAAGPDGATAPRPSSAAGEGPASRQVSEHAADPEETPGTDGHAAAKQPPGPGEHRAPRRPAATHGDKTS